MQKTWLMCLVLLAACDRNAGPASETSAPEPTATAPAASAPTSQPASTSQPAAPHAMPQAAAPTGPARAGGLTWSDVAPLVRRTPKSSMRAAQYAVEGDETAELTVFYFGAGQGGSVDDNVKRWLDQLRQPDGSDTAQKAKRSERKVGTINLTRIEATGMYGGGMAMPGMPAPAPIEDAMMLGAIAMGPNGPVFFKLVGPRASVERARPGFDAMLESLKPDAGP